MGPARGEGASGAPVADHAGYKIGIESNLPAYSYSSAIGLFNS